jgi:hypothetical protein
VECHFCEAGAEEEGGCHSHVWLCGCVGCEELRDGVIRKVFGDGDDF